MDRSDELTVEIALLTRHNHRMLHALLRMLEVTSEQLDELMQDKLDDEELERIVGHLKKPTEALAAAVKANK